MGFEIVRIIWADLDDPAAIDRRIRIARQVALQRRRAVRGPDRGNRTAVA